MLPRFAIVMLILIPGVIRAGDTQEKAVLPAAWHGHWAGKLRVISAKAEPMNAHMELHITPLDGGNYTWTIVYGDGDKKRQERKYELVPGDKGPDHFVIDEKNGSFIDLRLLDGSLRGMFRVKSDKGANDALIATTYRLAGDKLIVEMTTFPGTATRASEIKNAKMTVESYLPTSMQIAELTRQ
jgi:hypothetical protein